MVALNRNNGSVVFSRTLAPKGFPVVGFEPYGGSLFSVIGGRLVEVSSQLGTEISSRGVNFRTVCPVVRNESYFYLGGADARVHALRSEDMVHVFAVAADDDSQIESLVADEEFFVFGTDTGRVYSIRANRASKLWDFSAAGGIVGSMVRSGDWLYLASGDTNVYRVNIATGALGWKYPTGGNLETGPRVTERVVYQYVRDKGLAAIDKVSGKNMWQENEAVDLLAEAKGKAYVITRSGELA